MKSPRYLPASFRKVLLSTWRRLTGRSNHVRIGEREIEVKPIKAKAALEVLLLVIPYLKDVLPSLIAGGKLTEPKLFRETMREIMVSMAESFPMDVVKMMSVFLNVDEKWLEQEFYPQEMVEAFTIIARVNRLDDLMRLGLSVGILGFGDLTWLRTVPEE